MATLQTVSPTLVDLINSEEPGGGIAAIAEILNQTNEVLDYIPWVEGNLQTGHQSSMRTGIPEPTYRSYYQGVQPSKATVAKVTDAAAMAENYSQVDKSLADLNGNSGAFRASQDRPLLQGFSHAFVRNLFYGNDKANPKVFLGLAPRFSTVVTATAQSAQNVIDGGGTASVNTSVWLCVFSDHTGFCFYPKGSKGGLYMKDLGEHTQETAPDGFGNNNALMQIYRTHYKWDHGFALPDWRYFVRIANIDVSLLTKDASAGADLIDLMTQALELVQSIYEGRAVFCVSRKIRSFLRRQMVAKIKSSTLTWEMVGGKKVKIGRAHV